ncbi:MAG: S41 family peptidase [Rhodospirillales bacterium]
MSMYSNIKSLRFVSAVALFWVAACTTVPRETAVETPRDVYAEKLTEVFNVGYSRILSRYIDPVNAGDLAVSGLNGLLAIDSTVVVNLSTPKKIIIQRRDTELASFDRPLDEDLAGWVTVTVDAVTQLRRVDGAFAAASTEQVFQAAFDGAMSRLDTYSRYFGADDANRRRSERSGFGGIGIGFKLDGDVIRVLSVHPESPADRAGLQPGDSIFQVDGVPVVGWGQEQVIETVRGKIGTEIRMLLRNGFGLERAVSVRREKIVSPTVIYKRMDSVAYIQLTGFRVDTANRLEDAISRAKRDIGSGLRGIILDLRNNPGGFLDQSVRVSDLFLSHGRIVSAKGRHPSSLQSFEAHDGDLADGLPMVVIVDGRSASAAEIVASALQDAGRAVVIGATSYGKGTVQNVIDLPNEAEIALTWARFHAPSGYALQHLGVMPTVCTSAVDHDARQVLKESNARRKEIARQMIDWRLIDVSDEAGRQGLRNLCPSRRLNRSFELDVAMSLLDDRVAYLRALDASVTAVAGY